MTTDQVSRGLGLLHYREMRILEEHHIKDKPMEEVAAMLNISVGRAFQVARQAYLKLYGKPCIVCGAEVGQPCTRVSGPEAGHERPYPHFYRDGND